MTEKGTGRTVRALRRGVALGLSFVALWAVGLTADVSQAEERLSALSSRPGVAVGLLARQLGAGPVQERALEGWGRLLVDHCPLLAAGEEGVLSLRRGPGQGQQEERDPAELDGDDQQEPELEPPQEAQEILEMTGAGKAGSRYLSQGGVYVYDRTSLELDGSVLTAGQVDVPLGEGPQILIVHTHGSESYSMTDGELYEQSDPYRTTDCTHNVVRVGEEMAAVFRAHGFQVLHDTTLFDYPAYNGAYDRSQAAVEDWLEKYPTIRVVLDVHRDALVGKNGEIYKMVSQEAGEKVAQVMMVVGTDGGGRPHPRWRDNLAFALRLQKELVRGYTSLARPTVLRNSRYNQQLSPGSILVEVGGHGNSLTEALAGARLWADCTARTLRAMEREMKAAP